MRRESGFLCGGLRGDELVEESEELVCGHVRARGREGGGG